MRQQDRTGLRRQKEGQVQREAMATRLVSAKTDENKETIVKKLTAVGEHRYICI